MAAALMLPERGQQLRLYRLWRTAALLCGLGAVEIGVLAWQRRMPMLVLVCLPSWRSLPTARAAPPSCAAPCSPPRVAAATGTPHIRWVAPR